MLENVIKVIGGFLQPPTAWELFHELVGEGREGAYRSVSRVDIPLQGRPCQGRTEGFAHGCFSQPFLDYYSEDPLLILGDMIIGSLVPSSILILGKENLRSISISVISSAKGVSA